MRRTLLQSLIILTLTHTLVGCVKPYYGHTKEQWESLSEEERKAIKAEYEDVLNTKNNQRHTDTIDARKQQVIDLGTSAN